MKTFKDFRNDINETTGAAPTVVDAGLASVIDPNTGKPSSPPVYRKKQKTYQEKEADRQKEYAKGPSQMQRRVMGGVNMGGFSG